MITEEGLTPIIEWMAILMRIGGIEIKDRVGCEKRQEENWKNLRQRKPRVEVKQMCWKGLLTNPN